MLAVYGMSWHRGGSIPSVLKNTGVNRQRANLSTLQRSCVTNQHTCPWLDPTNSSPVKEDAPHLGVVLQQRAQHAARAAANVCHCGIRMLAPIIPLHMCSMGERGAAGGRWHGCNLGRHARTINHLISSGVPCMLEHSSAQRSTAQHSTAGATWRMTGDMDELLDSMKRLKLEASCGCLFSLQEYRSQGLATILTAQLSGCTAAPHRTATWTRGGPSIPPAHHHCGCTCKAAGRCRTGRMSP